MNRLLDHAKSELEKAGLFDKDSDYAGMIGKAVMKLVEAHSEEGHSGGSHYLVLQAFNRVINFKTLSPLTADPKEWVEIERDKLGEGEGKLWQSTRQSSCFSRDRGNTWYDIDDPKSKATRAEMALRRKKERRKPA